MDNNPYASPIGVEAPESAKLSHGLGLTALLLSVVAMGLLFWVASRIGVDRSQSRIPIITWHSPGKFILLSVASFAWLLSVSAIVNGFYCFAQRAQQSALSKRLAAAGTVVGGLNFILSVGFWGIATED